MKYNQYRNRPTRFVKPSATDGREGHAITSAKFWRQTIEERNCAHPGFVMAGQKVLLSRLRLNLFLGSTRTKTGQLKRLARGISEEPPHMGSGNRGRRGGRCTGSRTASRDGAMQINAISGGSMQRSKQTAAHRPQPPILTASTTGPTSRNSGLQPNRSSRRSPIRIAATRIWQIDRNTGDVSYH